VTALSSRTCERCGKKHLGQFVWLELDSISGKYHHPGDVPQDRSQGLFAFGTQCAKRAVEQKEKVR
jgi:hypothetical protein